MSRKTLECRRTLPAGPARLHRAAGPLTGAAVLAACVLATTAAAPAWATVTGGGAHTCATRTDTTLWCWGGNSSGQLGIGTTVNQDLPQQITTPAATGWASVTTGWLHTCAARTDTTLWCW